MSAKQRVRGPTVLERQRAEEEAALRVELARPSRKSVWPSGVTRSEKGSETAVSGGKSFKTGMVLARAQLSQSSGGIVAACDRQNTLLGKGLYRKAEQVAREAAVGTLSAKDMPKRKDAKDAAAKAMHPKAFGTWMRGALSAKVWPGSMRTPRDAAASASA